MYECGFGHTIRLAIRGALGRVVLGGFEVVCHVELEEGPPCLYGNQLH